MDLLSEAKKGDREAFKELTKDLEIKLYKTARYYFMNEEDVIQVMKFTLKKLFSEIVNVKKEEQLLPFAIKILIKHCEDVYLRKSKNKLWVSYLSSSEFKDIYEKYRYASLEEQYMTSLPKELRLISILYFYDGLDTHQIASILKMASKDVEKVIETSREKLYLMISNEGTKQYNDYVRK